MGFFEPGGFAALPSSSSSSSSSSASASSSSTTTTTNNYLLSSFLRVDRLFSLSHFVQENRDKRTRKRGRGLHTVFA